MNLPTHNPPVKRADFLVGKYGWCRSPCRHIAANLVGEAKRQLFGRVALDDDAFCAYLAEQGAPAPLREEGHYEVATTTAATRRLLTRPDRPDAIFCANDMVAIAAINVARHEYGLDVGREISMSVMTMCRWPHGPPSR
jgi:DNA-binding LacI/PurR family transcriptional regulator